MSEGIENNCAAQVSDVQGTASHCEEEEEIGISFNPPVYRQRYQIVGELIRNYRAKKVLDFGCAEAKLLKYLIRNDIKMEHLVGVDIDGELLKENTFRIQPLLCDWLEIRESPFTVSMLQGSISQADDRFCDFDLICCVEIIEHLIPEHLELMPAVVFGQLTPKVVIVTTPNADFNVLFPNLEGFRHWDHKFEWTREEFQQWSTTQAVKYGYNVSFQGIGKGPEGTDHLGCCSQMALFEKRESCQVPPEEKQTYGQPYEMIEEVSYPYRESTVTQEQKIMYEVDRLLWFLSQPNSYEDDDYDNGYGYDDDDDKPKSYEIAQLFCMGRLKELCGTIENLRSALEESTLNLTADGNAVLYSPPKWESDNSEEDSNEWNNGWENVNEQSCDDNNPDSGATLEEDWDLEDNDQNNDVCWKMTNNASVYWNGCDNTDKSQPENDDYHSDSDEDSSDCANWKNVLFQSNWVENKTEDDDILNDSLSDDGLPWITTN